MERALKNGIDGGDQGLHGVVQQVAKAYCDQHTIDGLVLDRLGIPELAILDCLCGHAGRVGLSLHLCYRTRLEIEGNAGNGGG
jgi:hypothetical protein